MAEAGRAGTGAGSEAVRAPHRVDDDDEEEGVAAASPPPPPGGFFSPGLDDGPTLAVAVVATRLRAQGGSKVIFYDIEVNDGDGTWRVHRRYTDFCALRDALPVRHDVPPRLAFGNFDAQRLDRRRGHLDAFLRNVAADGRCRRAPALLDFLGVQPRLRETATLDSFPHAVRSGRSYYSASPYATPRLPPLLTRRNSDSRPPALSPGGTQPHKDDDACRACVLQ